MVCSLTKPTPRLMSMPSRNVLVNAAIMRLTGDGRVEAAPYRERSMSMKLPW
jgi:hypothetical protein